MADLLKNKQLFRNFSYKIRTGPGDKFPPGVYQAIYEFPSKIRHDEPALWTIWEFARREKIQENADKVNVN